MKKLTTMKKIFSLLLTVVVLFCLSCDNFDEDEYLIWQSSEVKESTPITTYQSSQTILLEDYTGWQCVNCPSAAVILNELQTKYAEQLIGISVHAGSFAEPGKSNNFLDLRTEYGERWNTLFGLSGYPVGVINRHTFGTSKAVQKDQWDEKISELLTSTQHKMNINMGVEDKGSYILVSTQYQILKDMNMPLMANIVVLEDSIIGVQLNSNANYGNVPIIENYVFNHVLRTNGQVDLLLGEVFSNNSIIEKNYKINVDASWQKKNFKFLVFFTDNQTQEVIQANEIALE